MDALVIHAPGDLRVETVDKTYFAAESAKREGANLPDGTAGGQPCGG